MSEETSWTCSPGGACPSRVPKGGTLSLAMSYSTLLVGLPIIFISYKPKIMIIKMTLIVLNSKA